MHLFYTPDISSDVYSLPEHESRHCQRVLRLGEGDVIHLTDGIGTLYEAAIIDSHGKNVVVQIKSKSEEHGKRPYRVHLAVAPTKNIDRFEWFLEKATEIGIDEITPLLCEHSERRTVKPERLIKVITSAVKQSLKAYHPVLHEIVSLKDFISHRLQGQLFIGHLQENDPVLLKDACLPGKDVTILIGPEGDFSNVEIEESLAAGYQCVSLGNSRLRTETAAVVACHTVYLVNS